MSKLEGKIEEYKAQAKELGLKVDDAALRGVTKACGPNIYKADASKVSTADKDEVARVRDNFIGKKLGVTDTAKADAAIAKATEVFGSSNRNKTRALFYYICAEELGKIDMFK